MVEVLVRGLWLGGRRAAAVLFRPDLVEDPRGGLPLAVCNEHRRAVPGRFADYGEDLQVAQVRSDHLGLGSGEPRDQGRHAVTRRIFHLGDPSSVLADSP
jgi:hypothetical protein